MDANTFIEIGALEAAYNAGLERAIEIVQDACKSAIEIEDAHNGTDIEGLMTEIIDALQAAQESD